MVWNYQPKELEGLTEAQRGPNMHDCDGTIVDATISRRRIILICWHCCTFWHTNVLESDSSYPSVAALIRAADTIYALPRYRRFKLSREARDQEAAKMYALYQRGITIEEIAERYSQTRQSVDEKFRRRGWPLRPRCTKTLPEIAFNGALYRPDSRKGYWRRTDGDRNLLHRDMYEFYCGPLPDDWQVSFRDGNRDNFDLANLFALPGAKMTRFYHPPDALPQRRCLHCGEMLARKQYGYRSENPAAFMRRKFCSRDCWYAYRDGQPRTYRAE